jgi:hypothetical protein
MMSMPRAEKMAGIQSTKFTWKSEPFLMDFEKVAASMRVKRAMENCAHVHDQREHYMV